MEVWWKGFWLVVLDKRKTEDKATEEQQKGKTTKKAVNNPVNIIAQINAISPKNTLNKLYGGYNSYFKNKSRSVDYIEFTWKLCEIINKNYTYINFYNDLHKLLIDGLNIPFTGIGIYNDKSKCIHLKITNKAGASYSSRIFEKDENSEVIKAFSENNSDTLNFFSNICFIFLSIDKWISELFAQFLLQNIEKWQ